MNSPPSRVLVLGGTGFLGRSVVAALNTHLGPEGSVVVAGRTPPEQPFPATFIKGDRRRPEFLRVLHSMRFHTWIDLAMYTELEAQQLVDLFASGHAPKRLFVAGSIAEYGLHLHLPLPVAEDAPLRGEGPYARGKIEAWNSLFAGLADTSSQLIWGVLPQMWGPGDPHGRDALWIEQLFHGTPIVLRGSGRTIMPDGFVQTIAEAIVHLACATSVTGRVNIAGEALVTPVAYLRHAAQALKTACKTFHLPPKEVHRLETLHDFRFRAPFSDSDLALSLERLRSSGFRQSISPPMGFARTALWHREHPTTLSSVVAGLKYLKSGDGILVEVPYVD